MIKDITIGDQIVKMEANAAMSYRYKSCFRKDLFVESKQLSSSKSKKIPMEFVQEIGYIMAMAGAGRPKDVSMDGYFEWLESFEFVDMLKAGNDIANLYLTSKATGSESKKKSDQ